MFMHSFLFETMALRWFLLQADFFLTANREDIDISSRWNHALCEASVNAFVAVVDQFNASPFRYKWLQYLPKTGPEDIFTNMRESISKRLRDMETLESCAGVMRKPSLLTHVTSSFTHEGLPLTLNSRTSIKYLSSKYPHWQIPMIHTLEVREMPSEEFLLDFKTTIELDAVSFRQRSLSWHSKLARVLSPLLGYSQHSSSICTLSIIPLRNGTWISASDHTIFFSEGVNDLGVPEDIPFLVVDERAEANSDRKIAYQSSVRPKVCAHVSLNFSRCIFVQGVLATAQASELWFVSKLDRRCLGSELYVDWDLDGNSMYRTIFGELGRDYPFLHGEYKGMTGSIISKWIQVRDRTEETLELRSSKWKVKDELSCIKVKCKAGTVPLRQTCLPQIDIDMDDITCLPVLNIEDYQDRRWEQLAVLGIAVRKDVHFYLMCLDSLRRGTPSPESVSKVYRRLESELAGNEDLLRKRFQEKPLICVARSSKGSKVRWLTMRACLEEKCNFENESPKSKPLFRSIFASVNININDLVREAKGMSMTTELVDFARLFTAISHAIRGMGLQKARAAVASLQASPIFPIRNSEQSLGFDKLRIMGDEITEDVQDMDDVPRALKLDPHRLSKIVESSTSAKGRVKLHGQYSSLLRSKARYISRLVSKSHPTRELIETQLQNLQVFTADQIVEGYKLISGSFKVAGRSDLSEVSSILEGELLQIFLTEDAITSTCPPFKLVGLLADICGIQDSSYHALLQATLSESKLRRVQQTFYREGLIKYDELQDEGDGMVVMQAPSSQDDYIAYLGELLVSIVVSLVIRKFTNGRALQTSKFLEKQLGSTYHPEIHWTSPRRTRAGHTMFDGSYVSNSPFTISTADSATSLTRFLVTCGYEDARNWSDSPPHYHIEVVSTTSEPCSTFAWTVPQFERARQFRLTEAFATKPTNVMLLMRIANIHSNTSVFLHVGPRFLYMQGRFTLHESSHMLATTHDTHEFDIVTSHKSLFESSRSLAQYPLDLQGRLGSRLNGLEFTAELSANSFDPGGYFAPLTSGNSPHYSYAELTNDDEIRLLSISPGEKGSRLRGVIFRASLLKFAYKYRALSYTWGPKQLIHRYAESTLQRDRLFALLGFTADGYETVFASDYESPFEDIVKRYAWAFIKKGRVMDLLYRGGLGSGDERFPSWIPDWTRLSNGTLYYSSKQGVPCSAAGRFSEPQVYSSVDGDMLEIQGLHFDEVAVMSNSANNLDTLQIYLAEVNQMIDSFPPKMPRSELKWRVPIVDAKLPEVVISTAVNMHSSYKALAILIKEGCALSVPGPSHNTSMQSKSTVFSNGDKALHTKAQNYINALQTNLREWRFIITKKGRASIVPKHAQVEDKISIFNGGGVPFLLRKSGTIEGEYRLVGECYVHGVMYTIKFDDQYRCSEHTSLAVLNQALNAFAIRLAGIPQESFQWLSASIAIVNWWAPCWWKPAKFCISRASRVKHTAIIILDKMEEETIHRLIDAKYRIFKTGQTVVDLVAVERTKPNGRIVGIDIIPAQPPKGVSTIQGNFLSMEVREEVKRFLSDPDRGRPKPQLFAPFDHSESPESVVPIIEPEQSYIDLEKHADDAEKGIESSAATSAGKKSRRSEDRENGRMVDVVLSDMSAPWEQTTGFWKRSLSDPYIRMMNTSGISFKDHAGSMDLCAAALQFAFDTLKAGGHLVVKFYQGSEDKLLEKQLKKLFGAVHREKPESSRSVSVASSMLER
ncbi:hypothetical protein G7Y89_g1094 [Cudoniella acicularis]|uniref:rRNA methyltransferase 2, mitochondrial n=1 Tax=Cudoniella acicularis TaxID=354080 RepID=A0A8H4RWS1_9HELO|nr:hypothetical protein G7Y89_g1094 [Cudoniella acicularis]